MGRSFALGGAHVSFFSRLPICTMYQPSEWASPIGSIILCFHWISRWVLVKVPSFSSGPAAGSRNTSVWISAGFMPGPLPELRRLV